MSHTSDILLWCAKCRSKTSNSDGKVLDTANGLKRLDCVCAQCGTRKSSFLPSKVPKQRGRPRKDVGATMNENLGKSVQTKGGSLEHNIKKLSVALSPWEFKSVHTDAKAVKPFSEALVQKNIEASAKSCAEMLEHVIRELSAPHELSASARKQLLVIARQCTNAMLCECTRFKLTPSQTKYFSRCAINNIAQSLSKNAEMKVGGGFRSFRKLSAKEVKQSVAEAFTEVKRRFKGVAHAVVKGERTSSRS